MLDSRQRRHLAGLAQSRDCLVTLGRAGSGDALVARLDLLLERHELVKLRFGDFKATREAIAADLAARTRSELVRIIGNVAVFWRRNPHPEKRKVEVQL